MKFYVAGIQIDYSHTNKSTLEKTRYICDLLATIQNDAATRMGNDAVVVVMLEEYALTPMSIPAADKRESLKLLQQEISKFKQMILIPGSYASYEKFDDEKLQQHKLKKLKTNYQSISLRKVVPQHSYEDEEQVFNGLLNSDELADSFFLQNTAYILTAMKKYQHKKAAPYYETGRFPLAFVNNVYYIGHDDFIKHLSVNGKKIDAGIFICIEHHEIDHAALLKRERPPLLHALVSATIDIETDKLIGALNIQMDKCDGLVVVKNNAHFRALEIEDVVANTYKTGSPNIVSSVNVRNIDRTMSLTQSPPPDIRKPIEKREREDEKDINIRKTKRH